MMNNTNRRPLRGACMFAHIRIDIYIYMRRIECIGTTLEKLHQPNDRSLVCHPVEGLQNKKERERKKKTFFCLSAQSHADRRSVITHRLREDYSTVSLPGDDQEERKNDTQLKTIVMLLEMIDREKGKFSLSLSLFD